MSIYSLSGSGSLANMRDRDIWFMAGTIIGMLICILLMQVYWCGWQDGRKQARNKINGRHADDQYL
jgi:hypothetical protein